MASSVAALLAVLTIWSTCISVWVIILKITDDNVHNIEIGSCRSKDNQTATSTLTSQPPHSPGASTPLSTISASPSNYVENRLLYYYSQLFYWSDDSLEKCTLVLLIHQKEAVPSLLSHYCGIEILKRILLVWNNVDANASNYFQFWVKKCKSDLKIIQPHTDKLTNRYLPWQEIETDCVYLADEGQNPRIYYFLTAYEAWRNSRHLLVGYQESSFMRLSNKSYIYTPHEKWRYIGAVEEMDDNHSHINPRKRILRMGQNYYLTDRVSEELKSDGYSIMSTPCFVHRAYLQMFFDPLIVPASAVKYVEKLRDCEDILLSIVVTKFLQDSNKTQSGVLATKGPISLKGRNPPTPHYNSQRSQCLNRFSQLYGHLPLQLSNLLATN